MSKESKKKPIQVSEPQKTENNVQAEPAAGAEVAPAEPTAAITAQELEALKEELEKAKNQVEEYKDGWLRERADFANYKRRIERDQVTLGQNITGQMVKKYLPVMDDLERALKSRPTEGEGAAWAEGVELVYRKLARLLEAEGVQRIPAETELFDPTRHEAITHEANPDYESGQIIEVVQQGYILGDRVLRPAQVRVAQ